MSRILIAVPSMDMVSARFAQSLAMLEKVEDTYVSFITSSLIYDSRNQFCEQAIKLEVDYILWLDSDIVFPPNTLKKLLSDIRDGDLDIVSGLYYRRGYPYTPVLFSQLEKDSNNSATFKGVEEVPDSLFEVAGCGFGCVLMKTDVLFDIASQELNTWFSPMGNIGEDCSFCLRARSYGYKIYCDPTIKLGHMGYIPITRDIYENMNGDKNGKPVNPS